MNFLMSMLSSEAKVSSKRFIGFMAFVMLIASWTADTFWTFEVKEKILVGLGVTAAEKFGKPTK